MTKYFAELGYEPTLSDPVQFAEHIPAGTPVMHFNGPDERTTTGITAMASEDEYISSRSGIYLVGFSQDDFLQKYPGTEQLVNIATIRALTPDEIEERQKRRGLI